MAWFVGKYFWFYKKAILCAAVCFMLVLGTLLGRFPCSLHWQNYLLAISLTLCQMIVKNNLYKDIPVSELKQGMILSMASSCLMQGSRVRGLPEISSEDLRDRLTQEQVMSIIRWAKSRQIQSLAIVKKIPFAVFIALGFLSYFGIWSVT